MTTPSTKNKNAERSWMRNPKTTQERRANDVRQFMDVDGVKVKIRAVRLGRHLPSSWDDILIPMPRHKSWKKLRGTKWKA